MNVLHICGDYDTFHKSLVIKQMELGANARVFKYTTRWENNIEAHSDDFRDSYNSNIKFLRSPLFFRTRMKNVFNNFYEIYKKDFKYDIIHAHMWFSDGEIAYKAYELFGTPYILAVRNTDMNSWFYWNIPWNRKRGYRILKNAARVVFLSPSYKDKLITRLPRELGIELEKKAIIVPNGIDEFWHENKLISPRKKPKGTIRILTVGGIEPNKNQITVMKALKILIDEGYDVEYIVVGRAIDKKIELELSKYEWVKLIPFCPKEKLKDIYNNSDIFVMPSIFESFGLVYAEAMSQGLPVIYSKGQGFDGQFQEGEVGISVNCMSPREVSDAILRILADYEIMSSKCIDLVKAFNNERLASRYLDLYSYIILDK